MTGLLDTNVALYLLGGRLAAPLPTGTGKLAVCGAASTAMNILKLNSRRSF